MPAPAAPAARSALPARDMRAATPPQNLDTPRTFPHYATRAAWERRRRFIRRQVLVSCGLYPLPPRTPLHARVFGRVERDGYTIEKVAIQTYPGFYLAGNLYRPLPTAAQRPTPNTQHLNAQTPEHPNTRTPNAKRQTPNTHRHPAVLIAHGHWSDGRMADSPDGSIAARAITFARQGYVAFTYDMVGYNDTRQIDHHYAGDRRHWLWGISLMGLQTWNSIRALDFLCELPDVDRSRLAITGESGGGTQTMMLAAIEDRLAAAGPCVMVSHSMQGGCLCENSPGLRVEFSNMELAAAFAPKPQIMVGATGDWTRTMMTVEGPGVESVYRLYGKPDNLKYVIFDYGHNINKTSREAVYEFFGDQLLGQHDAQALKEPPYHREAVNDLRVFPDSAPLPEDAKNAAQLTDTLMAQAQRDIDSRKPHDEATLAAFRQTFLPVWEQTLGIETPKRDALLVEAATPTDGDGYTRTMLHIGRKDKGDNIPAVLFTPHGAADAPAVILVHPAGKAALQEGDGTRPGPLATALLRAGRSVLLPDLFLTGERADAGLAAARNPDVNYFTTYNRTDAQERVQDLVTLCAMLRQKRRASSVALVGLGRAGLWTLLAAPIADAVAADCSQLDLTTDDALLANDLYVPCLRRLGDFRATAVLAAPHPLLLHNAGDRFTPAAWVGDVYHSLGAGGSLRIETAPLDNAQIVAWLAAQR
jgi:dienelactone hydrolase